MRVWRRAPGAFPDSSSVLENFSLRNEIGDDLQPILVQREDIAAS